MNIRFNGKEIDAQQGDTIASALYRSGQRIFSRSFKYHRPRGLLCCSAASELHDERGWNAEHPHLYHTGPRRHGNWRLGNNLIQGPWTTIGCRLSQGHSTGRMLRAGITRPSRTRRYGMPPNPGSGKQRDWANCCLRNPRRYEHSWMHAATAVLGGGASGIAAALAAAGAGESVVLADGDPTELGGKRRYRKDQTYRESIAKLASLPDVKILHGSYCFGLYEGNLLGVLQARPHAGAAERLVHPVRGARDSCHRRIRRARFALSQ